MADLKEKPERDCFVDADRKVVAFRHALDSAMELVEGPTLADKLTHGAIPLEESLRIARLIAAALEAAHEKSIIHGDLKPANIKIKPDG